MNIQDIKIGTKLEIELINSAGEKIGQTFISQIMDITDSTNIVVAAPMFESKIAFIPTGEKIRLIFIHDKYGLVSFIGTIYKKEKYDNLVGFRISVDTELQKIQRRNYFRLDYVLDVQYRTFQFDLKGQGILKITSTYKKALTRNISGCGACIVTEEEIPKDSGIELVIALDPANTINVLCKIVRLTVIEQERGKKYEYGLYFIDIPQKHQNAIVKFVFDQQKLMAKKANAR